MLDCFVGEHVSDINSILKIDGLAFGRANKNSVKVIKKIFLLQDGLIVMEFFYLKRKG